MLMILLHFLSFILCTHCTSIKSYFEVFSPNITTNIQLFEDEEISYALNCSEASIASTFCDGSSRFCPHLTVQHLEIARITAQDNCASSFTIKGLFLGRSWLYVNNYTGELNSTDSNLDLTTYKLPVTVVRRDKLSDKLFIVLVTLLVSCSYIGMGCEIDLKVVKEVLLKPISPVIGFLCQYIIMPLTAFAVVMGFGIGGGVGLGLFAAGCAPGGGASNMYTLLLDGDVSLSITMTFISTVAALGMFPLWIFTLGRIVYSSSESGNLKIPYPNIMITLATMIIPLSIGLLIRHKCQKAAKLIKSRLLRPFCILLLIFFFTFGIYNNLYILNLITPILVVSACTVPWVGFLGGGLIAFLTRQPKPRIVAIAIETGVQNSGVAILLLKFSLPQPDADLSLLCPVLVACLIPVPLFTAIGVKYVCGKVKARRMRGRQVVSDMPLMDENERKPEDGEVNEPVVV